VLVKITTIAGIVLCLRIQLENQSPNNGNFSFEGFSGYLFLNVSSNFGGNVSQLYASNRIDWSISLHYCAVSILPPTSINPLRLESFSYSVGSCKANRASFFFNPGGGAPINHTSEESPVNLPYTPDSFSREGGGGNERPLNKNILGTKHQ